MRKPIEIECRKCHAAPGNMCVSRNGSLVAYYHQVRVFDALPKETE